MNSQTDQNIDHTEREKFDAVASGWWDPAGPFRPLHELNPARVRFIAERAKISDAQILDVGCGGGILAESLARKGGHVTGIDVAPRVLSTAKLHLHESGLDINYQEKRLKTRRRNRRRNLTWLLAWKCWSMYPIPLRSSNRCRSFSSRAGTVFFPRLTALPWPLHWESWEPNI